MTCFCYKNIRSIPFWLYLTTPIGGVLLLTKELFYLNVQEWFLIFTVVWYWVSNKNKTFNLSFILLASFLFAHVTLYTLLEVGSTSTFEILKTFKPYFFILIVTVFLATKNRLYIIDIKYLPNIILAAIIIDVAVWAITTQYIEIMPDGIRKEFFIRNNIYRYYDSATLLLQSMIILSFWYFKKQSKKILLTLISFIVLVFITQDRTFAVFGLATLLFYSTVGLKLILMILGLCLGMVLFKILDGKLTPETADRLVSLTNIDLLLNEFFGRFIEPVIKGGYETNSTNLLFGEGMGFKFYTPWHEYRELEVYHNSIDSFFVTFFVKYGIFGLILFSSMIHVALRSFPKVIYVWVVLYLCAHNGLYLPQFLLMLVFLSLLYDYKKLYKT